MGNMAGKAVTKAKPDQPPRGGKLESLFMYQTVFLLRSCRVFRLTEGDRVSPAANAECAKESFEGVFILLYSASKQQIGSKLSRLCWFIEFTTWTQGSHSS